MKAPKEIYVPNSYPSYENEKVSYTIYKYHGIVYKGCVEFIHWWFNNNDGKWHCFKIYLEKGNRLYQEYQNYLKNGNDDSGWSSMFVEW